jgi:hypothetical protein
MGSAGVRFHPIASFFKLLQDIEIQFEKQALYH